MTSAGNFSGDSPEFQSSRDLLTWYVCRNRAGPGLESLHRTSSPVRATFTTNNVTSWQLWCDSSTGCYQTINHVINRKRAVRHGGSKVAAANASQWNIHTEPWRVSRLASIYHILSQENRPLFSSLLYSAGPGSLQEVNKDFLTTWMNRRFPISVHPLLPFVWLLFFTFPYLLVHASQS